MAARDRLASEQQIHDLPQVLNDLRVRLADTFILTSEQKVFIFILFQLFIPLIQAVVATLAQHQRCCAGYNLPRNSHFLHGYAHRCRGMFHTLVHIIYSQLIWTWVGRNTCDSTKKHCILKMYSVYPPERRHWHQTWKRFVRVYGMLSGKMWVPTFYFCVYQSINPSSTVDRSVTASLAKVLAPCPSSRSYQQSNTNLGVQVTRKLSKDSWSIMYFWWAWFPQ